MPSNYYHAKVVLITGASSGIGKEIAKQLLILGANVAITGRNQNKMDAFRDSCSEYASQLLCIRADMRHEAEVELAVNDVIKNFGLIDILITNAGSSGIGKVNGVSFAMMKEVIDTNIYGTLLPIMKALPEIIKQKGSILLVSSLAGIHGLPDYSAYSLSKMSLRALMQSLNVELKGTGVKVCLSYVGFTENEPTKIMFDQNANVMAVPLRPSMLLSSRKQTASRMLWQLKNGITVMGTAWWGGGYRILNGIFPGLISVIIKLFYKSGIKSDVNQ